MAARLDQTAVMAAERFPTTFEEWFIQYDSPTSPKKLWLTRATAIGDTQVSAVDVKLHATMGGVFYPSRRADGTIDTTLDPAGRWVVYAVIRNSTTVRNFSEVVTAGSIKDLIAQVTDLVRMFAVSFALEQEQ